MTGVPTRQVSLYDRCPYMTGVLSSECPLIRVSSHQSVLSSECPLIRVSSHQSVLSSECPLIRVSSHQSVLSSECPLIKVSVPYCILKVMFVPILKLAKPLINSSVECSGYMNINTKTIYNFHANIHIFSYNKGNIKLKTIIKSSFELSDI